MGDGEARTLGLSARRYRLVDVATKVAGVVLVGGALEVGPTAIGLALGAAGVLLATATVFVERRSSDSAERSSDSTQLSSDSTQ